MCDHSKECRGRFDKIDEALKENKDALKDLDRRLFKGNGNEPWDIRINNLEQKEITRANADKEGRRLKWAVVTMILATIGRWVYTAVT